MTVIEWGPCSMCGRPAWGDPGQVYCQEHVLKSIGGFPVVPILEVPREDRRIMEGSPSLRDPPRRRPLPFICRVRLHAWRLTEVGPHDSYEEYTCLRCGDRMVV